MIASVVLANTMMAAFANVARADIKVGRSTFKAHDEKGQALKGIISTLKDLSIQKGDQGVANECDRLIELINHSKTFKIDAESKELIVNIFLRSVASLDIIKQFLESDPLWSEVLDDLITAGKQSSKRVEQDFGQIKFEDSEFVEPAETHKDYASGGSTRSAKGAGKTFVGSAMYPAGQKDLRAPRNQNGKISYDYVRDINKGLARR